ncbi:VOC family protein [Streptomyces sp. NPDC020801]|uniref:VOC family protein n=1 Tax=unclassified Streptomyces TaxID=2593676 RepID=UPI0037AB2A15
MTQTPAAPAATPLHWKLVIDAADPHAQADFWAAALHYELEDNSALIERLLELGALPGAATVEFHGRPAFRDLIAVRHPDDPYDKEKGTGLGRRLLFQRVPEASRSEDVTTDAPPTAALAHAVGGAARTVGGSGAGV